MAQDEAIWHVIVDGAQQGPLTKAQVFEFLRGGTLAGGDLIWRPGFPEWKSVSEISEFWRPPPRTADGVTVPAQSQARVEALPELRIDQPRGTGEPSISKQWSLWKSANIGLGVSNFALLLQIANGSGYELANYAHARSADTISYLSGQILAAPLIFVLIALARNRVNRRQARSDASAVRGALTFAALIVSMFAALFVYGEVFFSSTEAISGEVRKTFVAGVYRACVQKQRSLSEVVTEEQIHSYCTCAGEKMADGTTYKQLGTKPDASAIADLRQRSEAVGNACR
jgi:hypothetical protein